MTKYQIMSPNGVNVCIIKADQTWITNDRIGFYNQIGHTVDDERILYKSIGDIPTSWAAIQVDFILTE
jgi:hypothetical protein